ncbi:MAG: T9SS type A sorting domain-containing protein [Bacteroidetes bacterium]|nr:T9SS type A sorting domain-containing protein [Bacteroidota bacterium]
MKINTLLNTDNGSEDIVVVDTISGNVTNWTMNSSYSDRYDFRIISSSICGSVSATNFVTSEVKTSIDEVELFTYIYPNPADNLIYINSFELDQNSVINMYDVKGILVLSSQAEINSPVTKLDVQRLKPGTYTIQYSLHKKIQSQLIIIQ